MIFCKGWRSQGDDPHNGLEHRLKVNSDIVDDYDIDDTDDIVDDCDIVDDYDNDPNPSLLLFRGFQIISQTFIREYFRLEDRIKHWQ